MIALLLALALHTKPSTCDLYDERLCEPSRVRYCPDTGTQVEWMVPCPNLILGPDRPGGNNDDDE